MLYLSPDEADEFSSPLSTFGIQAHFDKDWVSPSMRLQNVKVYANFNYMNGNEVGKKYAHGSTPTSKTLGKLADALTMLRDVVDAPFFMRLFEIEGQWNITETENGYKFIRVDSILPNEVETPKNNQ